MTVAAFVLQQQSPVVATELTKSKVFTTWSFTEEVC